LKLELDDPSPKRVSLSMGTKYISQLGQFQLLLSVNISMEKCQVLNKIIHILVLTASIGIFGRQAISCLLRYYQYETTISLQIQSTKFSTFPSFTICPAYLVAYKSDILEQYGLTVSSIRNNLEYPKNVSSRDFFNMISHKVGDVIKYVKLITRNKLNGTSYWMFQFGNYSGVVNDNVSITQYLPFDLTSYDQLAYGKCYSFTGPKRLRHLKIRTVELVLKMDAFVFIHHEGQFLSIDTVDKIPINTGGKVFVDVNHAVSDTFFLCFITID
jgi:hypothetical protein